MKALVLMIAELLFVFSVGASIVLLAVVWLIPSL